MYKPLLIEYIPYPAFHDSLFTGHNQNLIFHRALLLLNPDLWQCVLMDGFCYTCFRAHQQGMGTRIMDTVAKTTQKTPTQTSHMAQQQGKYRPLPGYWF